MSKIFRKYYFDVNIYNLALSAIVGYYFGFFMALMIFSTIGTWIGILNYQFSKNHEYYMYQNLGVSKTKLIRKVCLINLVIALPFLIIVLFLIK